MGAEFEDPEFRTFQAALDLTGVERRAFMAELEDRDPDLAHGVRKLIRASEARIALEPRELEPGDRVGPYVLEHLLGQGGFGQVWRAQRAGMRPVALKVLRARGLLDAHQRERFERERDALLRLEHHSIAAIIDSDLVPIPYVAIALVDGVTLTEHAQRAALSTTERVHLLLDVCRGIQHAHDRGILHRDLKPANVLVAESDGQPRVQIIDFGIARFFGQDGEGLPTLTGESVLVGTPAYMSPEQAGRRIDGERLDVDVRSDVFQLGRLLFELLVGEPALTLEQHDVRSHAEAMRRLCEEPPASCRERLRALGRAPSSIPRDLDAITTKAMALAPADRYQAVRELEADLAAWLAGEPVRARRPSAVERVSRFLRIHRQVIAPAAVIVAALASVAWVAERGRRHAEDTRARLARVLAAQVEHLEDLDVTQMGLALRRALIAQSIGPGEAPEPPDYIDRIDHVSLARATFDAIHLDGIETSCSRLLADQPEQLAEVLATLAQVRFDLGLFESARRVALRANDLYTSLKGQGDPAALLARHVAADALREMGRHNDALAEHDALVMDWSKLGALGAGGAKRARLGRALARIEAQDIALAEEELTTLCTELAALSPREDELLVDALATLAGLKERGRRLEDALADYQRAFTLAEHLEGADPILGAKLAVNIGRVRASSQQLASVPLDANVIEEMERHSERILELRGDEHPDGLTALNGLTILARAQGDPAATLAFARRTWAAQLRSRGEESTQTLMVQANLVMVLGDAGEREEAVELAAKTVELSQRLGTPHPLIEPMMMGERGRMLGELLRFEEAERLLIECHDRIAALLGPMNVQTRLYARQIADFYRQWHAHDGTLGKDTEAARWTKDAE